MLTQHSTFIKNTLIITLLFIGLLFIDDKLFNGYIVTNTRNYITSAQSASYNILVKCSSFDKLWIKLKEISSGYKPSTSISENNLHDDIFEQIGLPEEGNLFVVTYPSDATVRILNIKPLFSQGISLNFGDNYQLEVSHPQYITEKRWVKLTKMKNAFEFKLKEKNI